MREVKSAHVDKKTSQLRFRAIFDWIVLIGAVSSLTAGCHSSETEAEAQNFDSATTTDDTDTGAHTDADTDTDADADSDADADADTDTTFLSVDEVMSPETGNWATCNINTDTETDPSTDTHTVFIPYRDSEPGQGIKIIRAFDEDTLVSFDQYRGLQILNVANPASPETLSQIPVNGTPVALIIHKATVLLLMQERVHSESGTLEMMPLDYGEQPVKSVILSFDISDLRQPVMISRLETENVYVREGHLVSDSSRTALYVVHRNDEIAVSSFTLSASGALSFVATSSPFADVSVFKRIDNILYLALRGDSLARLDLSSTAGEIVPLPSIPITGALVETPGDIHRDGDILKIVTVDYSGGEARLETWNVADINVPVAVDSRVIQNELLYSAQFIDDRLFTTSWDTTGYPHAALKIDPQGLITDDPYLKANGRVDSFQSVFSGTRILAIRTENEADSYQDKALAIELYDADPTNLSPLIDSIALDSIPSGLGQDFTSWIRFQVLENAVSVPNTIGELETGLITMTNGIQSWPITDQRDKQLITFSPGGFTVRGSMKADFAASYSFAIGPGTIAETCEYFGSDSDTILRLNNYSAPDDPSLLSSTDLAPPYSNIYRFGEYNVRVRTDPAWEESILTSQSPHGALELVSKNETGMGGTVLSSIEIHPGARVYQDDNNAVVLTPVAKAASQWKIDLFNFSNPLSPVHTGSLSTELPGYIVSGDYSTTDHGCAGFGCRGIYTQSNAHIVGDAFVYAVRVKQNDRDKGGNREWDSVSLHLLDLTDASQPTALPSISLNNVWEIGAIVYDGATVYVNHSVPVAEGTCDGPCVRNSVTIIHLDDPTSPVIDPPVRIPGQIFGVHDNVLISRDRTWLKTGETSTALHSLRIRNGQVEILSSRSFPEEGPNGRIHSMILDDSGRVFATSGHEYPYDLCLYNYYEQDAATAYPRNTIAIFDVAAPGIPQIGELKTDPGISLQQISGTVALFKAPIGVFAVALDDLSAPFQWVNLVYAWDLVAATGLNAGTLINDRYGVLDLNAL